MISADTPNSVLKFIPRPHKKFSSPDLNSTDAESLLQAAYWGRGPRDRPSLIGTGMWRVTQERRKVSPCFLNWAWHHCGQLRLSPAGEPLKSHAKCTWDRKRWKWLWQQRNSGQKAGKKGLAWPHLLWCPEDAVKQSGGLRAESEGTAWCGSCGIPLLPLLRVVSPLLLNCAALTQRAQCHLQKSNQSSNKNAFYLNSFSNKCAIRLLLDLECPPKAHVLKAWSLTWCYWKVVRTFKRWGLPGGFRSLDNRCGLRGDCGMSVSSSLGFTFSHKVRASSTVCSHRNVLPSHRFKQLANQPWTETSKSVSQNKPLLF
jgi:hypothetical protein